MLLVRSLSFHSFSQQDSAVLVDIQNVDIGAVDIAVEPVEDLLGLLLLNGVAIEVGAVGVIEVIIPRRRDCAIGIEVMLMGSSRVPLSALTL